MSKQNKVNTEKEPIKIILLGNTSVGKTAIITRFDKDNFDIENPSTFSPNYIEKTININNKDFKINVWYTAGQEKFQSVSKIFIKNAKIVILVYDITNKESFTGLKYWYDFLKNEYGEKVIMGLAGNKIDLLNEDNYTEEVSDEEGENLAKELGAIFSLLSAKCDKKGIDDFFMKLITKYLEEASNEIIPQRNSIKIGKDNSNNNKNEHKGGCC